MGNGVTKNKRRSRGPNRPLGLTVVQVSRQKTRLRGNDSYGRRASAYIYPTTDDGGPAQGPPEARTFAASQYWIDQQLPTRRTEVDGVEVTYQIFEPGAVPAGQGRCKGCGRQTPPQLIGSSGHCYDCRAAELEELAEDEERQTSSLIVMRGGVGKRFAE